ncbi:hypothetical protein B0T10DRAFT_270693 [Thelonectria olida]|uniref:ADF-H domain-containing protein n=1 Tax=Thelonectria olida TaxID=1576542 RepID=A0A9P8WBS1_9HYPO|nr:hypothetical protein B0T10DRAFT_270693 [Thelonectria olida]
MSLNGLDDPKIQEAHEAAVAEPGGWFLLKYASRDEVELLGRGSGGIVEVRTKISEYDETSPLYGFLRYRRRNVLIKYLPEDCSRLIQARVTVHFNAVCERFSPYDTTFDIAVAKDLKDTKLSAACSLHAASGSNSSATSSIRRRRLVEIAEEEEEEQQQRASKRQSLGNEGDENERPRTPKSDNDATSENGPVTLNSELASSPEERKFSASSTSDVPNFVGADETPGSPEAGDAAGRLSSQSGRPDYYPYNYGKPKVKLGPRPSLDVNGRPRTAGSFRPVSQIPAGMKMFGKNSKKGKKEDEDEFAESQDTTNTEPIPEEDNIEPTDTARPTTSSGVSTTATIIPAPPPSKPTISPEKARLMKAMKLREKRKKKNMTVDAASGTLSPDILSPTPSMEEAALDESVEDKAGVDEELEDRPFMSNADSAIGLDGSSSMTTDQGSDLTQSDSHPASPVILSSEPDHSTKASSLSESTDETVHAKSDDAYDEPKDHEDDALDLTDPAQELKNEAKEPALVIENNPKAPAAAAALEPSSSEGFVPTHATAGNVAAPDTSAQPAETKSGVRTNDEVAAPIVESDSIPAPHTSTIQTLNGNGSKTDSIPVATEIKGVNNKDANVANKKDEEPVSPIATPTLTVSEPKFPDQAVPSEAQQTREGSPIIVTEQTNEKPNEGADATAETKTKRRVFVEPIRTDLTRPDPQVDHLSDDEDLMEELQSATVHEAKSMLVSKSPVTPVFPSPTKSERSLHFVRTVSNPVRGTFLAPGDVSQSSARSVSSGGAAYLHKVAQQPVGPNLAKKSNMGSSISQRIKALEKLSAHTGEAPVVPRGTSRERPSSTFFSVRKGREPSRSPSVVDRANSFTRPDVRTPPSRSGSRDESPDTTRRPPRDRSLSVASRLSMFEATPSDGHSPGSNPPRGRPEAISVTAKIVRDTPQPTAKTFEPPKDPTEFNHLELKQSPLLVDHQKPVWTPMALELNKEKDPQHERRVSKDSNADNKSRRSSLSVVKDFIKERRKSVTSITSEVFSPGSHSGSRSPTRPPSISQGTSFTQRLSISSRRSSFNRDREAILSPTGTEGSASGDEKSNSDKKKSRTGRFMRRLSGFGSRGKIAAPTGISPTVTEEDLSEPVRPATTAGNASIVANMGDVNVQFPDNLLWKRRNMCLDAQGFLILSAIPGQSGRAAQGTKRYHMGDFRQPYPPDVDVQELPNSVALDFMEGSGIQVACEDRAGQMKVLATLQDAHRKHAAKLGH